MYTYLFLCKYQEHVNEYTFDLSSSQTWRCRNISQSHLHLGRLPKGDEVWGQVFRSPSETPV